MKEIDFDTNFEFVSSVEEYNENVWNDLHKYIKRKTTSKTDDKIKKLRINDVEEDEFEPELDDYNSDISLSSSDLQYDNIKDKKKKKKSEGVTEKLTIEDASEYDENMTFHQMNLSRPLMKAITQMKFSHPTPIQAATVAVALLGICD